MANPWEICGAPLLAQGSPTHPRVTLALFAYNQQTHIRAAVEGALAQDYDGPLEIILSDDGSRDDTFAVMQDVARAYRGPHHMRLNRNDPNLGLTAHVNRVMTMAQGEIIVMAAGDDISLPARVRDTVAAFGRHPQAMAVSFSDIQIDQDGQQIFTPPPRPTDRPVTLDMFLAAGPRAQSQLGLSGASRAFRRKVWDQFGPLQPNCPAEDTPLLRRALYLGPCIRCDWPGIYYRIHDGQMSTPANIAKMKAQAFHAQYLTDLGRLSELGRTDLPLARIRAQIEAEAIEFALRGLQQSGEPPDLRLILQVLPATGFRMREKLGLLKRFLIRKGLT